VQHQDSSSLSISTITIVRKMGQERVRLKIDLKSRTPLFCSVPNLDFPGTPITLKQHFRPDHGTLWERLFRQPPGR